MLLVGVCGAVRGGWAERLRSPGASEWDASVRKASGVHALVFSGSLTLWPEQDASSCFNTDQGVLWPLCCQVESPESLALSSDSEREVLLPGVELCVSDFGRTRPHSTDGLRGRGAGAQGRRGALAGHAVGPQPVPGLLQVPTSSLGNEKTGREGSVLFL